MNENARKILKWQLGSLNNIQIRIRSQRVPRSMLKKTDMINIDYRNRIIEINRNRNFRK